MKRTTTAAIILTALAGSTAGLWQAKRVADRPPPAARFALDDRPLRFVGGLTNKGITNRPPYGEHPGWAAGDPVVVYQHLDGGTERVVFRAIVGPGTIGYVLFSAWHPLTEAQRDAFRIAVRRWKAEDQRRTVGVFFRRDATNPLVRRDVGIAEGPYLELDPRDPTALRYWEQNTAELAEIVDEFWLDGGSASDSPDIQAAIVRLARHVRSTSGAKVGVEAIPIRRGPAGQPRPELGPDWDYLVEVPALAHWRYVWKRWIEPGRYDLLEVPARYRGRVEVHVLLHPGRPSPPEPFAWPPPTQADIDKLEAFGWTISWLGSIFEVDPAEGGPPPLPEARP